MHFISNVQFCFDKNDQEINTDESDLLPICVLFKNRTAEHRDEWTYVWVFYGWIDESKNRPFG